MTQKTILLVEDEELLRDLAVCVLQEDGYSVVSAANFEQALRIWNSIGPTIDLLVTDIILPGLDGIALAAKLRSLRPNLHVVFMTGSVDRQAEVNSLHGHNEFIAKPYIPKRLTSVVRDILSH